MSKLIFFCLMPFIYELICFLFSHFGSNWHDNKIKKEMAVFSIILMVDYLIELVFILLVRKESGGQILFFMDDQFFFSYTMFKTLAIIYIVITIIIDFLLCISDSDTVFAPLPILHTIILIICFVIFCLIEMNSIHSKIDEQNYANCEYQKNTYTTYLIAMVDSHDVSGEINGHTSTYWGTGGGYIHGQIDTDYTLYYSCMDGDRVVIRKLPYNESNTNIYIISDDSEPRIVFHQYSRNYQCEKGHNFADCYYIYDVYVPSMPNNVNLNLE